jgi:hypothetical protein
MGYVSRNEGCEENLQVPRSFLLGGRNSKANWSIISRAEKCEESLPVYFGLRAM